MRNVLEGAGDRTMTSEPAYQALFLGAGPQMQCGVGQFTRLLRETIEQLDPGSCATLTLTRSEGSLAEIWRAVASARNVVCNFPIVAWKRVMFRPLLALAIARLRGRRVILIQHEWAGLHRLRRITYVPALLLADTIVMFSPLVRRELADDFLVGWTVRKCRAGAIAAEHRGCRGNRRFQIAAAACRRAERGTAGDRPFRIDLPGQAAECAARHLRDPEGARAQAADGLYRIVHPRRRQGRAGVLRPRRRTRRHRRRHCQRLCRVRPRGVRPVQRDRCVLLSARRGPHRAALQRSGLRAVRPARDRHRSGRTGRVRPSSALQGIDRPRRHRAGGARCGSTTPMPTASSRRSTQPSVQAPFDFDGWWRDVAQAVRARFESVTPAPESAPDNAGRTPPAET